MRNRLQVELCNQRYVQLRTSKKQDRTPAMKPDMATSPDIESTYRSLCERLSDFERLRKPVWVFDTDLSRVVWCNHSSLEVWQADSMSELLSRDMGADMSASVANRLKQYQTDFVRTEGCQFREVWTVYPNNEPITFEVVYSGITLADGRMAMFCEALAEPSDDAESIRSAEALLHTSVMISLYAATGESLYRNPAARAVSSSHSNTLQEHFNDSSILKMLESSKADEINTVASVSCLQGIKWHDITARRCLDASSGKYAWLISEVDVSKLKATEERAQFLAEHDLLTKLPNRNYVTIAFENRIEQLLAKNSHGAVVFLDLDRFKDINDSLGHAAGDELLVTVAKRLISLVPDDNAVARLGGDEFLVILTGFADREELELTLAKLQAGLSDPVTISGREMQITPSIGVSLFPENGRKIDELMRRADLAMYHAKDAGRDNYAFFHQDFSDALESRINLDSELIVALEEDQFVTFFQPRVDVDTNAINGAEGLVRWMHPTKGMVSPATFIPACESSGLIAPLGKRVLAHSVCAQREWASKGYDLRVSVNLSPQQFVEENMVDEIIQIVEQNQGNPESIEFEITESVLLGNDQTTIDKLHALVDYGFRIAIDDFGTGYSNLAYLHRYPLHCLKIDRSFVQGMGENTKAIVELIVSMAKLFNLKVVAEGVEMEEQLSALIGLGCHEYQGFLFSRPIAFEDFNKLLETEQLRQSA